MKVIYWNSEKNHLLKQKRQISFEDIYVAITEDRILADEKHPNSEKYDHQRLLIVEINQYAYIVPYVEDEKGIFLKTIYPSRIYTKKYLNL